MNKEAKVPAPSTRAQGIGRAEIVRRAKELTADEAEARVGEGGRRIERKTWIEGEGLRVGREENLHGRVEQRERERRS